MIDHSLLHPTLTDADLQAGCALAARYRVASVCIKPYAVAQAVEWLEGSGVAVGTVVGFPHGSVSPESKWRETDLACTDGASRCGATATAAMLDEYQRRVAPAASSLGGGGY